ncbi:19197_t:CDS:1 [Dentiscutata erythropus]|uniref:19197_t:CDS:1 n=1 Tax=Dentiscutata erythropus TaxID=1348616 RepID=A0A9N8VUV7_9GLOM|nr:19197_t:CDS:1 [Dentiscutata erythropus]
MNISIKKLLKNLSNPLSKPPAVLLISGSFNPVHLKHIHILEVAKKYLENQYEIVGGYISPFSNDYVQETNPDEAIPLKERLEMIQIVIDKSSWIEINESLTSNNSADCNLIITTLSDYLNENNQIKEILKEKQLEVIYVCGSDLIKKYYPKEQLKNLENFKVIIIKRYFKEEEVQNQKNQDWTDEYRKVLAEFYKDKWNDFEKNNVIFIDQNQNENDPDIKISSTKIREIYIEKDSSWEKMCHPEITEYIKKNKILEFKSLKH